MRNPMIYYRGLVKPENHIIFFVKLAHASWLSMNMMNRKTYHCCQSDCRFNFMGQGEIVIIYREAYKYTVIPQAYMGLRLSYVRIICVPKACQTLNTITYLQIRRSCLNRLGMSERDVEQTKREHPALSTEKEAWRMKLRETAYLQNPANLRPHVSLSSEPLDPQLINFTIESNAYQAQFLDAEITGKKFHVDKICVTLKEREKLNDCKSWTKEKIRQSIQEQIIRLKSYNDGEADRLQLQLDTLTKLNSKKDTLFTLVRTVEEALQDYLE